MSELFCSGVFRLHSGAESDVVNACLCGCGAAVTLGHRFRLGHHARVNHPRGMLGRKHTPEALARKSEAAAGRVHSPETKAKQAAQCVSRWREGRYGDRQTTPTTLRWNGRNYRSRYEVWAQVGLDDAGIRSNYEPYRFDLGDCTWLPDFHLPDHDLWLEVKGWMDPVSEYKIAAFRKRGYRLHVIGGRPVEFLTQLTDFLETLHGLVPNG